MTAQADKVAPAWPADAALRTTAVTPGSVSLAWPAADDAVGVTGYNVYRDGTRIATVAGDVRTYCDGGVVAGSSRSYAVTAQDYLLNVSTRLAVGPVAVPLPAASVGSPKAPRVMYRRGWRTVYGSLMPRHATHSKVRIYKWRYVGGRWKSYGYVLAPVHSYSTYSRYAVSMRLRYKGRWRLRAYTPADAAHAASWSPGYDYVTVR